MQGQYTIEEALAEIALANKSYRLNPPLEFHHTTEEDDAGGIFPPEHYKSGGWRPFWIAKRRSQRPLFTFGSLEELAERLNAYLSGAGIA